MGEIGGNDYNHPFSQGKPREEVQTYVPEVVKAIGLAIHVRINYYFEIFIQITGQI